LLLCPFIDKGKGHSQLGGDGFGAALVESFFKDLMRFHTGENVGRLVLAGKLRDIEFESRSLSLRREWRGKLRGVMFFRKMK
jgi:hypothetical protein